MSFSFRDCKWEWDELESLVKRARRAMWRMTPQEISRLDVLYRRTTISLAQVATRTRDTALLQYLNDLTAAAHSVIYARSKRKAHQNLWLFFPEGFARAVARTWRYHLTAAGLMLFGAIIAYFAVLQDSTAAYAIMPTGEFRLPGAAHDQLLEALRWGRKHGGGFKFFFSSFLFTRNLKVGLLSLATGVLCAVPTVLLVIYNGMILGAFTAIHHSNGIYGEYWAWILPHGVTEISALVLCGGVGLQLGHAVISPGLLGRGERLRLAGIEAGRICLGVAVMLVLAAFVEGYLRQSDLPTWTRLVFAGGTAIFWTAYFTRGIICERLATVPSPQRHEGKTIN